MATSTKVTADQLEALLCDTGSREGTDFKDLLSGNIDIVEYLDSSRNDTPVDSPLDGSRLLQHHQQQQQQRSRLADPVSSCSSEPLATTIATTMIHHPGNSANGQQQQQPAVSSHSTGQQQQQQQQLQQQQAAMVDQRRRSSQTQQHPSQNQLYPGQQHPPRLPDSPPETDQSSGGGSAGSPSSASDNSPYSPDYHTFPGGHLLSSTVIHPPMGHVPNGNGVILGVHDLSQAIMNDLLQQPNGHHSTQQQQQHLQHQQHPQQVNGGPRAVVHHSANGATMASPQQVGDICSPYPSSQPTPGALPQVSPSSINGNGVCPPSPYIGQSPMDIYGGPPTRKRLRSDSFVKPEPTADSPTNCDEYDVDGYPHQQCIRFGPFQEETWHPLCDGNGRELRNLDVHVVADKGFNYSHFDGVFVNQKKNHFQISVHIEAKDEMPPVFVKVDNQLKQISEFRLAFYGAKAEMPSSTIMIKQSQTDRKPIPHEPVQLSITERRVTKVTVPRLHFSETTMNNQRKNGKPNPDQKYIKLVVSLTAKTHDNESTIVMAHASENVIVRASNPGQFENGDSDVQWSKNGNGTAVFHPGPVCIGTDRPHGMLTVSGDLACTGKIYHPSDRRLKENISEMDCKEAITRLAGIRVVEYSIRPEVASQWGMSEADRHKVGVIAQELADVLPDAVREDGEYLTVDDSRIFYDTVAAAKELCRLTGNLECKIEEVEKLSQKLARLARLKKLSFRSTPGSTISGLSHLGIGSETSSGICAGASYLSCSRSTLASETASMTKKGDSSKKDYRYTSGRNSRHHKHCNHPCHRMDQGLCSNKIMQYTIVALVVVMAFCLVAMATLYVLDWHKRNIQRPTAPSAVNMPPAGQGEKGEIREIVWEQPSKLAAAPIAACKHPPCQTYCCADKFAYKSATGGGFAKGGEISMVNVLDSKELRGQDSKGAYGTYLREKRAILSNSAPAKFDVTISIPEYNITLDHRWCVDDKEYLVASCRPKEGRFELNIPMGHYLPTIPLDLVFETRGDRYVDACSSPNTSKRGFTPRVCELTTANEGQQSDQLMKTSDPDGKSQIDKIRAPESKRKSAELFELPVGDYIQSAYRFRVGYTTESCEMPDDQVGKGFDEYTLYFYRPCADKHPADKDD